MKNAWTPDDPHVLDALRTAEVRDLKLIYDSSNYVYLALLEHPEYGEGLGVYKPVRGEAPLGDFPYGTLHRREVAAYELSHRFGWDLVPPAVERDGPQGVGSMQLYIDHDPNEHYFALRGEARHHEQLVRLAVFDLVVNNADRKGGHILLGPADHVWGIDNALCFHYDDKLRTVVWDFAGVELPEAVVASLEVMRDGLAARDEAARAVGRWIEDDEIEGVVRRCDALLSEPVLPEMYPWRCWPWPLV